ncbi:lysozyme inhibitor LprI family protein [Anaeroselena agilis]|uniref:Lysozyme inhibitor LprI family protein n=1 Tax=Anaeroselena agilis TaxID=3063788 RepID=A0ABU3P1H0_9FIRM|nr:lysozyme inhibitor LprI family protein [Selenomonadales bacterium 4137-cl]
MRRFAVIVAVYIALLGVFPAAIANADENKQEYDASRFKVELTYPDDDRSQLAMNDAAARELKRADDTLNAIYNKVLVKYRDDREFIAKYVAAEVAWIAFRDAQLDAVFPKEDKSSYGSVYPMVYRLYKAELTWDRVRQLNEWLIEFPEGDAAAGSRRQ